MVYFSGRRVPTY